MSSNRSQRWVHSFFRVKEGLLRAKKHIYVHAEEWGKSSGFPYNNALNYFAYNFIKIHRTLRMNSAMAAGVTDRLWDIADLVALWEAYERRAEKQ